MIITTNNHQRELLCVMDLPIAEREQFDYIDSEDAAVWPRIVKYKGEYYDVAEFMHVSVPNWHGALHTSAWSGVLVRMVDGDYAVMGSYYES